MPAPKTAGELVELMARSHLLAPNVVERLRAQVPADGHPGSSAGEFSEALLRQNVITPFHRKCLLSGQYKGFFVGKYRVLDLLGAGGMGKVFLAEQTTMKRAVALKLLPLGPGKTDTAVLKRFRREARAVAKLRDPNIAQAFDCDQIADIHFIAMEYVEGLNLQELVESGGRLKFGQACELVRQAALGLQAAHEAKFVHRDIKPGNLMVEPDGTLKILDLGLVVSTEKKRRSLTVAEKDVVFGTADYLSPEQAIDTHSVDIRSDIYSLGCVLHFLLTGDVVFPGMTVAQKMLAHQQQPPPPVTELAPEVPRELGKVVAKMLRKDPSGRPAEPAEVAAALGPFAAPEDPAYDVALLRFPMDRVERYLKYGGAAPSMSSVMVGVRRPGEGDTAGRSTSGTNVIAPVHPDRPLSSGPATAAVPAGRGKLLVGVLAGFAACALAVLAAVYFLDAGPEARQKKPREKSPGGTGPKRPIGKSPGSLSGEIVLGRGARADYPIARALNYAQEASVIRLERRADGPWPADGLTVSGRSLSRGRITVAGAERSVTVRRTGTGPLLRARGAAGLLLENLTLDGADGRDPLIVIEGDCPGLTVRDVTLTNFRGPAIWFVNARGTPAEPVRVLRTRLRPGGPRFRDPGVLFRGRQVDHESAHVRINDCDFGRLPYGVLFGQPVESVEVTGCRLDVSRVGVWFAAQPPGDHPQPGQKVTEWRVTGWHPPGTVTPPSGSEWVEAAREFDYVNVRKALAPGRPGQVAFARSVLTAPDASERRAFLGADGRAEFTLNGEAVMTTAPRQAFREGEFTRRVRLKAGENEFRVRLEYGPDATGPIGRFGVRLADKATLLPPADYRKVRIAGNRFVGSPKGILFRRPPRRGPVAITDNRFEGVKFYPILIGPAVRGGDPSAVTARGNSDSRGPRAGGAPGLEGHTKVPLGGGP